jgi:hypothetical protein
MTDKQPSIFISSTIYDFRDLRSSLKYYLQSLGYYVYLSEFNDFPKALDISTFEAALQTLRSADYYLLLIGHRIGGLYREADQISITRMEYRTAYEEAKTGKIRLLILVTEEIWNIRSDRNALRDYMTSAEKISRELSDKDIQDLVRHPSPILNNANLIFDFLDEVSRVDEMRKAVAGEIDFPKANWIDTFSTFQDIVDILRVQLGIQLNLNTIALRTNLRRELLENLVILTSKHKAKISPTYTWATLARRYVTGGISDVSRIPRKYLRWILFYTLLAEGDTNLSTRFIDQALNTGEFLVFNKQTRQFENGLYNERLFQLRDQISRLRLAIESFHESNIQLITKYKDEVKREGDLMISNEELLFSLSMADKEQDIVKLTVSLFRALSGNESYLQDIQLNSINPFPDEAERIENETPTHEEVVEWLKGESNP